MKKKVTITVEKTLEIEIPDNLTTEEYMKTFSGFMWNVDTPDELFEHVAHCFNKDYYFAEGLGEINQPNVSGGIVVSVVDTDETYEVEDLE